MIARKIDKDVQQLLITEETSEDTSSPPTPDPLMPPLEDISPSSSPCQHQQDSANHTDVATALWDYLPYG